MKGCPPAFLFLMRVLLAFAAAACPAAVQAHPSSGWSGRGPIDAQYWIDASGLAAFEQARGEFAAGRGRPTDFDQVMPLGGGGVVWYRLQLPRVGAAAQAVLTVPIPGVQRVEMFRADAAGTWRSQAAGDTIPVDQWPVRYLYPTFGLSVQAGDAPPIYMRIENSHPVRVPWQVQDAGVFIETAKLWHLALGVYVGLMLLVVLLSVANALSWRDPIHLYYAVHVVLVGLSVLSLTGLAGEYLWTSNAWWNDTASILVPAISLGWAALFVRSLVAERGRWIVSWGLLALAAYSVLMGLGFVILGRASFYRAPGVYAAPVMVFILAVLCGFARRRPEVGAWVLAGVAAIVAGDMLALLHNLGWLGGSFLTHFGVQLGAALEIPLVLVGLYFRSRERRDNRVRLEALVRTDPLTGVGNHRVLMEQLEHLLGRSRRDSLLGAVLRVSVANLDAIRKAHGREAAEAAWVRAAECVAREAADTDTVAREEGGDLVLVMEGQVTHRHAAYAARNIIAHGLQFSDRLPRGVTLQLRVGGARAPLPHVAAPELLAKLRRAIDRLAHDPQRRALRFVDSSPPDAAGPSSASAPEVAGDS